MNAAVNAFFLIFKLLSLYFWLFHSSACAGGKAGSFRRTAAVRHIDRGQK